MRLLGWLKGSVIGCWDERVPSPVRPIAFVRLQAATACLPASSAALHGDGATDPFDLAILLGHLVPCE